jgi:hypothetical protein
MFIYFSLQIVNFLVDPAIRCTRYTRRDPEDGTRKIKVVRPLIGFRRCETQMGLREAMRLGMMGGGTSAL